MIWRWIGFVGVLLAGGLAGHLIGGEFNVRLELLSPASLGAIAGALVWVAWDTLRMSAFIDWLKRGELQASRLSGGWWGEIAERTLRRLRNLDHAVRDNKQRLDDFLSAIQASPTGVVLLADGGRIEWFNQMSAQHFGLTMPRDLEQFFVNMARDPEVARYFNEADFSRDIIISARSSTLSRPVRLSLQVYPYGEGRQLLLSRDITALEQAEAMRRDFVANVSHEIRTPLTVMAGFVETLQTLPLEADEQKKYLALMAEQSHRMQSLVNDLLVLSKLEGSPMPGEQHWVEVGELLEKAKQEATLLSQHLGGEAAAHAIELSYLPVVSLAGAASEILSAISNLANNAVRYTQPGDRISIRATMRDDGRLAIDVQDSGPGIAPEHLPRLTERFYRVDRSRSRETGGTGLGLSIVKHVMQRHGGELKVESQLGKGSTFSLMFPANRVRVTQSEIAKPQVSEAGARA